MSSKPSISVLKLLDKPNGGLAFGIVEPDPVQFVPQTAKISPDDDEQLGVIADILGQHILEDKSKVDVIVKARQEISLESAKVLRAAINMGRALIDARQSLTPREFSLTMEHSQRIWRGLSRSTITKMMAVADWHDTALKRIRIAEASLPQNYTTLYEITTLIDKEVRTALTEGLIRPDVSRTEVIAFKRRIRSAANETTVERETNPDVVDGSKWRYEKLRERRRNLLGELLRIRREMLVIRQENPKTS